MQDSASSPSLFPSFHGIIVAGTMRRHGFHKFFRMRRERLFIISTVPGHSTVCIEEVREVREMDGLPSAESEGVGLAGASGGERRGGEWDEMRWEEKRTDRSQSSKEPRAPQRRRRNGGEIRRIARVVGWTDRLWAWLIITFMTGHLVRLESWRKCRHAKGASPSHRDGSIDGSISTLRSNFATVYDIAEADRRLCPSRERASSFTVTPGKCYIPG